MGSRSGKGEYDRGIDDDSDDDNNDNRNRAREENVSDYSGSDGEPGRYRDDGTANRPAKRRSGRRNDSGSEDYDEDGEVEEDEEEEDEEDDGDTEEDEDKDEDEDELQDDVNDRKDNELRASSGQRRKEDGRGVSIPGNEVNQEEIDARPAFDKEEVISCAQHLGIDPVREPQFLWLAEAALTAPLPSGWKEYESVEGLLYFHHAKSGETQWEHPSDQHYRAMYRQLSGKKALEATSSSAAGAETLRRRHVATSSKSEEGDGAASKSKASAAAAAKEEAADEPLTVESEEYAKLFDRKLPSKRAAAATEPGRAGQQGRGQGQGQGQGQQGQQQGRPPVQRNPWLWRDRENRPPPRTFGEWYVFLFEQTTFPDQTVRSRSCNSRRTRAFQTTGTCGP